MADLYVFKEPTDYLCYVQGVHLLIHEDRAHICNFLKKGSKNITDAEDIDDFIDKGYSWFRL